MSWYAFESLNQPGIILSVLCYDHSFSRGLVVITVVITECADVGHMNVTITGTKMYKKC